MSEPHINDTAMRAIYVHGICTYVCMVRPSSARRLIDSVQGRMQSFVPKSLRSETTATACSNLANIFPRGITFKRGYAYARHQGNQASRCNRISDSTEDRRLIEKLVSDSTRRDQRLVRREKKKDKDNTPRLPCQWRPQANSTLCDLWLFPPPKSLGARLSYDGRQLSRHWLSWVAA